MDIETVAHMEGPHLNKAKEVVQTTTHKKWKHTLQYIFCCVGATIGLGNIWKFPYVTIKNGGASFLVCYFIVAIIFGVPFIYLESFVGQFSSKVSIEAYTALSPAFAGIAWSQLLAAVSISSSTGGLIAYTLFYFMQSISPVLPWTECKKEWGDKCITLANLCNATNASGHTLSEELYFVNEVLRLKSFANSNGVGVPNGCLVLCSGFVWFVNFIILSHGIDWLGHLSHLLVGIPYLIILVLLGRTVRFEGAMDGINYLFSMSWLNVFNPQTWYQAILYCLYSFGQGIGMFTTFASYNKFGCHIKYISGIIVFADTVTNILLAVAVFSAMGYLAKLRNFPVESIGYHGPALVFVNFPQVFSSIKSVPNMFSGLFYLMLFIMLLGSLLSVQLIVIENIHYYLPNLEYWYIVLASSLLCFVVSLMYFTPVGICLIMITSTFANVMVLTVLVIIILIVVFYASGLQSLCWDIEYMSQTKLSPSWRILWTIVEPITLITILLYTFFTMHVFDADITYSAYYKAFGWLMFLLIISPVPIIAIYEITSSRKRKDTETIFNKENWRPYDDQDYVIWNKLKLDTHTRMMEQDDSIMARFFKSLRRMYD